MATIIPINTNHMIDIHSHILPLVDDGSQSLETSILMIEKHIGDGTKTIILTPHVQSRVTKATRDEQLIKFHELQEEVKKRNLDVELILSAEIHFHSHLNPNYDDYSIGPKKAILVEFSTMLETPIEDIVLDLKYMGYLPIVAHVERYDYLQFEDYYKIKRAGALLQVNSTAVLGLEPKVKKGLVMKLLKKRLVDFIATDAHGITKREPNLLDCNIFLRKHIDEDYINELFEFNQRKYLFEK